MDEDRRAIIEAFENQIVETGWLAVRPALVAEAAGVPLDRARHLFPTKADLLAGLAQTIDEEVLSEGLADPNEPAK
ncbi:MAG: TetR/AcrR family transcriptional regulator, partial [Pseudomonadota bacterium]